MLLYLISKLKPTLFNIRFLGLAHLPVGFYFGQILAVLYHTFQNNSSADVLMVFIFLVLYLLLYRLIFIEVCKFLIKNQKKN